MKTLDLCLPAYNEAPYIEEAVRILWKHLSQLAGVRTRLLIAENGSTDNTAQIVSEINLPDIQLIRVPGKGKGLAIRYAAEQSNANFFGFIDADLSADPTHINDLLQPLLHDEADLTIGSRLSDPTLTHRSFLRTATSRIFRWVSNVILPLPHKDTQCGLKIMNERTKQLFFQRGREDGWFFDLELLVLAHNQKYRVQEHPIRWRESFFATRKSKLHVFQDGLRALSAFFRIRQHTNTI